LRVAKVFTTGITAAALALSMLASAIPAQAAAPGFHAAFFAQSAYPTLARGETKQLSAVYTNNGDQAWVNGSTGAESRLATDAPNDNTTYFDRGWSVNWLSANRYARNDVDVVAPGGQGSWTYTIRIPANEPTGTNRLFGHEIIEPHAPGPFNASQSANYLEMEDYGFFLDVTVGAPSAAPVLTSLNPDTGTTAGGTSVTITGTGFICTPAFPTVKFGTSNATVTSCGATTLVATSPAHAAGDVQVTAANQGGATSNGLTYTYATPADTTAPTYDSLDVVGQDLTLTFSEPVCLDTDNFDLDGFNEGDEFTVLINGGGAAANDPDAADCAADETDATMTVVVTTEIVEGDEVCLTINTAGIEFVLDAAGNAMERAHTECATAVADVTAPTMDSAEVTAADQITVTYSEPVDCPEGDNADSYEFTNQDDVALTPTGTNCDAVGFSDEVVLTFGLGTIALTDSGTLDYTRDADLDVEDFSGNEAEDGTVAVSAKLGPTIEVASVNDIGVGSRAGAASTGDVITLDFSEAMNPPNNGDQILVRDSDAGADTVVIISCAAAAEDDNGVLEADCALVAGDDGLDTITLELFEDITGETESTGATAGLQWPAEITDIDGYTSAADDLEVDLAGSDDTTIDE
jgi:IPT/TIG domain-containing protein/flagellar associated repeat protein